MYRHVPQEVQKLSVQDGVYRHISVEVRSIREGVCNYIDMHHKRYENYAYKTECIDMYQKRYKANGTECRDVAG